MARSPYDRVYEWSFVPLSKLDQRICWAVLTLAAIESGFFVFQAGFAWYQIFTNLMLFSGVLFIYGALRKGLVSGGGVYHCKEEPGFYRQLLPFFTMWYGFVMIACFFLHIQESAKIHEKVTLSVLVHRVLP